MVSPGRDLALSSQCERMKFVFLFMFAPASGLEAEPADGTGKLFGDYSVAANREVDVIVHFTMALSGKHHSRVRHHGRRASV